MKSHLSAKKRLKIQTLLGVWWVLVFAFSPFFLSPSMLICFSEGVLCGEAGAPGTGPSTAHPAVGEAVGTRAPCCGGELASPSS